MKLSSFAFLAVLYLAAFAAVSGSNANNNKNAARLKKFLFGPGSDNVEMWDKVFSSPSQNTQTVSQVGGIFDSDADRARNAIENDSITDFTAYWVKMVSKGSNEINHVYKDGYTPLLLAIEFNNEAIFDKIALTPGVKLIAKKSDGQTPLIASIQVVRTHTL